jgi:phosphatidylcholine synthase
MRRDARIARQGLFRRLKTAPPARIRTIGLCPSAEKGMPSAMRFRAYSVHIVTAAGAPLAMLALLEAAEQDWAMMAIWLAVAFIVDGVDGPLARRYDVESNAPVIDGTLLDLIVDFLTYVMIPAYALYGSGLLPGWTGWFIVLFIPFASSLYFADTRMKTADASFRGFPGCWNMVVLALLVIQPNWVVILGLVLLLSAAQFLTLRFIHPVRTPRWRAVSLPVAVIWVGAIAYSAWFDFASMSLLTWVVGVTSAYLLLAGVAQQLIYERGAPLR